jgi:hypothetical protein
MKREELKVGQLVKGPYNERVYRVTALGETVFLVGRSFPDIGMFETMVEYEQLPLWELYCDLVVELDKAFDAAAFKIVCDDKAHELEQQWIHASNNYRPVAWNIESKHISAKAWDLFKCYPAPYNKSFISVIASSIIFWKEEAQYTAIGDMWASAKSSDDLDYQSSLCSIINAASNSLHRARVRGCLSGIDNMDTNRYGSHMATLIGNFRERL